jgi:hypothetical protein
MATKRQASGAISTLRSFVKKCKAAKAAGHGKKKPKKRKAAKRDWTGHRAAHSKAAKKGHRKATRKKAKKSSGKKRASKKRSATHRDPAFFGRPARRPARRPAHRAHAPSHFGRPRAGGWRMTRDPE